MPPHPEPFRGLAGGGGLSRREQRQLSRSLTQLDVRKELGLARIEQQAQLEAAKTHAIGYIGSQAMQAVAMVSQLEGQLAEAVPLATTRLQGIADMTAMAMAQVVADSAWRLGR